MDIRFLITSLLLAVAWASEAAVPQLTDFNTNQFGTAGGIVTIKNGALVTNLVGAGSGSSDWTNTAWGLQPILTNSLVDIHHGTNAIWVNQLATGGNGTLANPWTGLESVILTNSETHYYWPRGYYKTTNTLDMSGQNCYHQGEAGTIIRAYGEGPVLRFSGQAGWIMGSFLDTFRIECSNAVRVLKVITALTNSGGALPIATATCTNHGYSVGDVIYVQGATFATCNDYNVVRCITDVPDADHFSYQLLSYCNAPSPATTSSSIRCAKASVALQMVGMRNGEFKNLSFANCDLGADIRACVTWSMRNVRCTKFEEPGGQYGNWTIRPYTTLLIGMRRPSALDWTTCGVIDNIVSEANGDYGIVIFEGWDLHFNEGVSEVNYAGIALNNSYDNTFTAWDNEQNSPSGMSWRIYGNRNNLHHCYGNGATWIVGGAGNRVTGGFAQSITVGGPLANPINTILDGTLVTTYTNLATPAALTRQRGMQYAAPPYPIDVAGPWMLGSYDYPLIVADAPVALNASLSSYYTIPFASSFTMTNPLNPTIGQEMVFRFRHWVNDSNPYVISWSPIWRFPTWMTTPITNSTAGGVIYMKARYNGVDTNWDVTELVGVTGTLNQGTTNTVQHGNAAGNPAYSSVTEYDLGLADITTANFSTNMHGFTPKGETNDQKYLQATGIWAVPTGTGTGANASEPYVTIGNVGSLSDERALTSGQVSITDNGAGSTVTIGATTDTPRFLRMGLGKAVDNTASLTTVAPILSSDGSLAAPSFSFGSETNLGFYRRFSGLISLASAGHAYVELGNAIRLGSLAGLQWVNNYAELGTVDLFLERDVAATLQMGHDAAAPIAQKFKAHDGAGANIAGASLTLAGGSGTGTGAGGDLITQTTVSSNASGSTLQIYSTRHYESAKPSPMTNSTANPVFNILIGSTHYFGCKIFATTFAADAGGDFQALSEELIISAVNKSGTISNTVSASWGSTLAASVASTLTTTWTAVTSGNSLDIKCTPVSSLTPTTYYTKWKVDVLSNDPATIAPYR